MLLGYNTNGMAYHGLYNAVTLLGELGYGSVAITIDHGTLPPNQKHTREEILRVGALLARTGMRSVIETGAPYILDPWRKHEPSLVSANPAERQRRIDFYCYAIACAAEFGSDCVSLWSGVLHDEIGHADAIQRFADGLTEVVKYAEYRNVPIGLEPEPGMVVANMHDYEEVRRLVDSPRLRLTLDIGHLQCQGELPIAKQIRRLAPELVNVHIEDMRRGKHEHLMFGEGEIDFRPVLRALDEVGYTGGVHVELSRHSHEAPEAARRAMEFLQSILKGGKRRKSKKGEKGMKGEKSKKRR